MAPADGPQDNLEDRFAREAGKYVGGGRPSKSKGGSLGTFKPGQMVKEFNEAVFEGPVGTIQGPVKTSFGWHLILVTDQDGEGSVSVSRGAPRSFFSRVAASSLS